MTISQPSHTPGPWEVRLTETGYRCETGSEAKASESSSPRKPEGPGGFPTEETLAANARLVAAAPDLLAALKTLLGYTDDSDYLTSADKYAMAHAAIVKAEGAQP